jgi:hypothetical protein
MQSNTPPASQKKINHRPLIILLCTLLAIAVFSFAFNQIRRSGESNITRTAEDASGHGHNVSAIIQNGSIVVYEELSLESDSSNYNTEVEQDCFSEQKAFWDMYSGLASVEIGIYGDITNPNQPDRIGSYGSCIVENKGYLIGWDALDWQQAWSQQVYTSQQLTFPGQ